MSESMKRKLGMFVEPKVFLIGYTSPTISEIHDYLEYTGNEEFMRELAIADRQGVQPAEALISFYAKLCYKSLSVGHNANVSQVRGIKGNVKGCIGHGHGSVFEHVQLNFVVTDCSRVFCFAESTELLTRTGWKKVADVTTDDLLLTKNPKTGKDRWAKPKRVHQFLYTGKMMNWATSQGPSPAVTDNHLLWAAPYDLRRFRGLTCEEIVVSAEKQVVAELYGKRIVVDNASILESTNDVSSFQLGEHLYDAYLLFSWLGWMATDGGFSKDRPNQCTISQTKAQHWPELEALMTELFGDRWRSHGPYETEAGVTSRKFVVTDPALAAWAKQMIGPNKQERDLHLLFSYTPRLLRGFLECAVRGDGSIHRENGHEVIYVPTRKAAGHYQAICSLLGKCATIRVDDRVDHAHEVRGVLVTQRKPIYVVSISRKSASLVSRHHWQCCEVEGERVYCPETEDGLVFARKRTPQGYGLPVWSGNTHELVRHRAGTAFSQTSGRYCRIAPNELQFVWDPILHGCESIIASQIYKTERNVYLMECVKGLRKPPFGLTEDDIPRDACFNLDINALSIGKTLWNNRFRLPADERDWLRDITQDGEHYPGITDENRSHLRELAMWVPTGREDGVDFSYKKKVTSAIRRIAPNGQPNEIGFSCNIRSLRHMIMMRTAGHAEWEIRNVFGQIYELVKEKFPLLFFDAKTRVVNDLVEVYGMKTQPYEMQLENYDDEPLVRELKERGYCVVRDPGAKPVTDKPVAEKGSGAEEEDDNKGG